jgi:hypothetical protein
MGWKLEVKKVIVTRYKARAELVESNLVHVSGNKIAYHHL